MSSDEDSEDLEGQQWDTWQSSTQTHSSSHRAHVSQIGFDAASMPCQKAVCYGYYPSIELNSMLLVKCKHCGMLLKDVGYGHHARSRHGFRAESPASTDESQSFLLSPPHHVTSPRISDPVILSPPYRKPSTSFHLPSPCEDRASGLPARTISPRYSVEQRDDLKLSLRVSHREVHVENGPESSSFDVKPVIGGITAMAKKQPNGRMKQKKKKKRKRDSSDEDHMSLEHLRRKKRLESQKSSCTDTAPCTSSALNDEQRSAEGKPLEGVYTGVRESRLRSPPSLYPLPDTVQGTTSATVITLATTLSPAASPVLRLSPLVISEQSATPTPYRTSLLFSSPQGSPRITALRSKSTSREQSPLSLSPHEAVSSETLTKQTSAYVQRCRPPAIAVDGLSAATVNCASRRMPLECSTISSPNQYPVNYSSVMGSSRGIAHMTPLRSSPPPQLSPIEQKTFLLNPVGGTVNYTPVAVTAGGSGALVYATDSGIVEGEGREEELLEYNEVRPLVNGVKGRVGEEGRVNFHLSDSDAAMEPESQTQQPLSLEVRSELSAATKMTVMSISDDEGTAFKDEMNENGRQITTPKQEIMDSPSSRASVIALSPEGTQSEMEVCEGEGGVVVMDDHRSEEEMSTSSMPDLVPAQPFAAPLLDHQPQQRRSTHIVMNTGSSYRRVHRSCSSPPSGDSACSLPKRDLSCRMRHENWKFASARVAFAKALGVPLSYPPLPRSSPPAIVSNDQLLPRAPEVATKMEVVSPEPSESRESTIMTSSETNALNSLLQQTTSDRPSELDGGIVGNTSGRIRVTNAQSTVLTTAIGVDPNATPQTGHNATHAASFRSQAPAFNSSTSMRTPNAMVGRGCEQQGALDQSRARMVAAMRGSLRKGASSTTSLNGTALHSLPQPQQQPRYVYVHTATSSPVITQQSDPLYTGSVGSDGVDVVYAQGQHVDGIELHKRSPARLLRHLTAQTLYELPSILKMRLSPHQALVSDNGASVLTSMSPLSVCSSPRRASRQHIESAPPLIDGPLVYTSSASLPSRTHADTLRTARSTHSYAVASPGGSTVLANKRMKSVASPQRSVTSFRRAQSFVTGSPGKKFTSGIGVNTSSTGSVSVLARSGSSQLSPALEQYPSPTATMQPQTSPVGNSRAGHMLTTGTSRGGGQTLASIRTGPRTVTVVPVLSRYPTSNTPSDVSTPQSHMGGLYRSSPQTITTNTAQNAACRPGYATDTRTC